MNSKTYHLTVENLHDKFPFCEFLVLDEKNWIRLAVGAFDQKTEKVLIENKHQLRSLTSALDYWAGIGIIDYALEDLGEFKTKTS